MIEPLLIRSNFDTVHMIRFELELRIRERASYDTENHRYTVESSFPVTLIYSTDLKPRECDTARVKRKRMIETAFATVEPRKSAKLLLAPRIGHEERWDFNYKLFLLIFAVEYGEKLLLYDPR